MKSKWEDQWTWPSVFLAMVIVVTLIWLPNWTIGVSLVLAVVMEGRPEWFDDEPDPTTSGSADIFACGVAFFFIEFLDWLLRYQNEIPFSDVFFPIADPPYDMRAIFFGWLFVFMAAARKFHAFLDADPKLD